MIKKTTLALLLSLILVVVWSSCSRPIQQDQLLFGIRAAQKDLWDEAIFRWKKVIAASPNSAAAHNNLAVAYEQKGLFEDAKQEYELALKLSPSNKYIESNYQKLMKILEDTKNKDDEKK